MEIPYNLQFAQQCKQYAFCFTCETCLYFDGLRDQCLHEYPNHMHRLAYYKNPKKPKTIIFCKQYELR